MPTSSRAHEPSGPFGAKSVGEIGINGVAAAIANAVADATGVRLRRLPMTGERVLRALLRRRRASAMKLADYPPQEPLSAAGPPYQERVLARGAGVEGREFAYGDDPYQRLTVYPAAAPNGDVLVFFHGGGWTSGYKEWMAFMAPALQARGVTLVTRRLPARAAAPLPGRLRRRADAVAWVHAARRRARRRSASASSSAAIRPAATTPRCSPRPPTGGARAACPPTSCAAACRSRASIASTPTAA